MNLTLEKVDVAISYSLIRVSLHPLTLAFTGSHQLLEPLFKKAYFSNSIDHVRRCKLYAILFFSVFGVLDAYVFPEQKFQLWFIRYVLVCPVFLVGLIFSYTEAYRRLWQLINAFYIMVTGFAYVAMVVITPAPEAYYYGVGIIFCVFFGYTFIHARFITASIAGLLVIAGYQGAMMWLMQATGVIQLIFGAHFMGINLLGMLICYSIETHQRKSFFLNYLLEKEKEKTDNINRNLEKRVEERTTALQRINRDLNKEVLERKQAEGRVRASHEQLASILDSIDADIHVSDMETHAILLANRHMKQTYGDEVVGKLCHEVIQGLDKPCQHCKNHLMLDENGRPGESYSWEEKNPLNGRWYIIYSRAIVWEDGRIVQLTVATDVTAMKEMEARLQRAQKMEAIGTLAGGVAHDLNNILSGLVGYPELLLMDTPEGSETRIIVETIKNSGEKAAAIVQDMLTLARRGVAATDVIGLNRVVEDYLGSPELAKLKSVHPQVTIRSDLAPAVFNIIGSPVHLGKTIMNLVTNAAEAMPDGGEITVSTQNCYVDRPIHGFETVLEGEYVLLRVADTGIGISARDLERIFEPFYTKKKMGRSGTGLGMAVVWGTVKDHGGFIDARSIEGQGTVFDLYFPITRQIEKMAVEELPIDRYRGAGESVLVVDDIKEQRDLAAFMLKRLDYQVDTVASGAEAVQYIRKKPVDILVLDMIMEPEMDGLDTYRQILAVSPDQKAVIASGFSESERVREAQRLGAGPYIKKPYRMEQIGMALREQLASSSPDEAPESSGNK
ncbi:ATP-binding protein [uncultured Desulfosarcina sp.]|uniref:ATP-binding protein n=1 Tax=uncultured Desulfosarcina sp. TaxID=218289 RepID=UPI0029C7BDD9|nr:ATP-binding protein [uncultured Desulfosarcina sp.]